MFTMQSWIFVPGLFRYLIIFSISLRIYGLSYDSTTELVRNGDIINGIKFPGIFKRAANCKPEVPNHRCSCRGRGNCGGGKKCICCYQEVYENPQKNCVMRNFCKNNPCQNGGTCVSVWGNHFCLCAPLYHGHNCEHRSDTPMKRISNPLIAFRLVATYNEVSIIFVILDDPGSEFSFSVTVGYVTFTGDETLLENNIDLSSFITTWLGKDVPLPKVAKKLFYYPYKRSPRTSKGDHTVGLSIELKNSREVQFIGDHSLYVVHDAKRCPLVVYVSGCAAGNMHILKILRADSHVISATVKKSCPEDDDDKIIYSWMYCNISKSVPYPFTESEKKGFNIPTSKKKPNCRVIAGATTSQYHIKKFSMTYGDYAIMLLAKTSKHNINRDTETVVSGWLRVVADPIIAELKGGNAVKVGDGTLIVDASNSRDPNEPPGVNHHLLFDWSCEPKTERLCLEVPKQKGSKLVLVSIPGTYKFTVTVSVDKNKAPSVGTYPELILPTPDTAVFTATVEKDEIPHLYIKCVKNCNIEVNAAEVLYLAVNCSRLCNGSEDKNYYHWQDNQNVLNEENTQFGLNTDKLIIRANVLTHGKNYTITVSGGKNSKIGKAEWQVRVRRSLESVLGEGKCSIVPSTGISGITLFNFTCDNYPENLYGFPLRYEMFQIPDSNNTLSEILVSYSSNCTMNNLQLTAGRKSYNYATKIYLKVEDHYAELFYKKDIATVTVKPLKEAKEFESLSDAVSMLIAGVNGTPSLDSYVSLGDMSGALQLISLLTVAIDSSNLPKEEIWEFKKQFIRALNKIPMYSDVPLRQVAAVVHLMLGAGKETLEIPPEAVRGVSTILEKLTFQLSLEINDSYVEYEVSTPETVNLTQMMADIMDSLSFCMNNTMNRLMGVSKDDLTPPQYEDISQYQDYYELNPNYTESVRDFTISSMNLVASIQNVGKALLSRLAEGEEEMKFEAGILSFWVKVDAPDNLKGHMIGFKKGQGLRISEKLAKELETYSKYIRIQVTMATGNPFSWDKESKDVNTGLAIINIYDEAFNFTPQVSTPTDLFFTTPDNSSNTSRELENGNVTVPLKIAQSGVDNDLLEDYISIHKIVAKEGQTPYLQFEPLQDPSFRLQIVVTVGVRPVIEHFRSSSITVPHLVEAGSGGNNLTVFVEGVSTLEKSWFYVGILPHPDTLEAMAEKMGEDGNFTIKYSFHVNIIKCLFWDTSGMRWSSEGCEPGIETLTGKLHCRCRHLSMFSGSMLSPHKEYDFMESIPMILLGSHNTVIPLFVAFLLTLYLVLLLWARWKDKYDINERMVTLLEDNYPGRSYTYLIGVYTGWKKNAGTTSNVGIQLIGREYRSTAHILNDSSRTVHARNSDNWFVIFTAKDLGELIMLRLWHDNSGHFPPWYCERVVVEDIQKDTSYTFLVQRWLSVVHKGSKVYCSLQPATPSQQRQESMLFRNNVNLGFQEQHIWTNIFMRHPLSTYTRIERLSILLCIILTTMLLGLLLYDVPEGNPDDQLDEEEFCFPNREFGIIIVAALILMPLHYLLVLLFRKTAPRQVRFNPMAEAFLIQESDKKQISEWWQSFFYVVMMEPLIHYPKVKKHEYNARKNVNLSRYNDTMGTNKNDDGDASSEEVEQEFKASRYWFPSWMIYIAWMLCIVLILICLALLCFFGLMYAEVKSQMWVVAVLMYIFLSIFIFQPLKVLIFSLILSFLCKKEPSTMEEVDVCFMKEIKEQEQLDRKQAQKLRALRAQQMYRPLKAQEILRLKRRERTRAKMADLFVDLCMFLVYIITLYWIAMGTRDDFGYYSTNSLKDAVILADGFLKIKTGKEFFKYMNETFIPAVHTEKYYNGEPVKVPAVTTLYDTRLLGLVQLRQIRIKNVSCEVVEEMRFIHRNCNAEFDNKYEQMSDYGIGWDTSKSVIQNKKLMLPWMYTSAWHSGTVPTDGDFALYPGGGYIATLGRTLKNSLLVFDFLQRERWLDHLTRAIFIEFTTYNANRNMFNVVYLLVEVAATGAISTRHEIKTVKLLTTLEEFGLSILIALILWLLVLLVFMLRQVARFGRISPRAYFQNWENIVDLIILSFAIIMIVLYFLRSKYVSELVQELEEKDGNEYVNFLWAGYWQIQLRYLMAALVCLSTARLWKLMRFMSQFRFFERTMVIAYRSLLPITFQMLVIIVGCACFAHVFIGHSSHLFSSFMSSLRAMISYGVGFSELENKEFVEQHVIIGRLFIFVVWIIYMIYLINIFTAIINISYEDSQKEAGSLCEDNYTMLDYIIDELRYIFTCFGRTRSDDMTGRQLSVKEKYPHYFSKTHEPERENEIGQGKQGIKTQPFRGDAQVFLYVQEEFAKWPTIKTKEREITEPESAGSDPFSAKYNQNLDNKSFRLRAGADTFAEPVYAPAIAVPKPDEVRYENAEEIPTSRLQAMKQLALNTVCKQEEECQHAIAAITVDCIRRASSEDVKIEPDYFYRGLIGKKEKIVPDNKLIEMETVINKMGAERYVAQLGEDNGHAEKEEDDNDEEENEFDDNIVHADVLVLQMVRLHNILSGWAGEGEGTGIMKKHKENIGKQKTPTSKEESKVPQDKDDEIQVPIGAEPREHEVLIPVQEQPAKKEVDGITDQDFEDISGKDEPTEVPTGAKLMEPKDKTKKKYKTGRKDKFGDEILIPVQKQPAKKEVDGITDQGIEDISDKEERTEVPTVAKLMEPKDKTKKKDKTGRKDIFGDAVLIPVQKQNAKKEVDGIMDQGIEAVSDKEGYTEVPTGAKHMEPKDKTKKKDQFKDEGLIPVQKQPAKKEVDGIRDQSIEDINEKEDQTKTSETKVAASEPRIADRQKKRIKKKIHPEVDQAVPFTQIDESGLSSEATPIPASVGVIPTGTHVSAAGATVGAIGTQIPPSNIYERDFCGLFPMTVPTDAKIRKLEVDKTRPKQGKPHTSPKTKGTKQSIKSNLTTYSFKPLIQNPFYNELLGSEVTLDQELTSLTAENRMELQENSEAVDAVNLTSNNANNYIRSAELAFVNMQGRSSLPSQHFPGLEHPISLNYSSDTQEESSGQRSLLTLPPSDVNILSESRESLYWTLSNESSPRSISFTSPRDSSSFHHMRNFMSSSEDSSMPPCSSECASSTSFIFSRIESSFDHQMSNLTSSSGRSVPNQRNESSPRSTTIISPRAEASSLSQVRNFASPSISGSVHHYSNESSSRPTSFSPPSGRIISSDICNMMISDDEKLLFAQNENQQDSEISVHDDQQLHSNSYEESLVNTDDIHRLRPLEFMSAEHPFEANSETIGEDSREQSQVFSLPFQERLPFSSGIMPSSQRPPDMPQNLSEATLERSQSSSSRNASAQIPLIPERAVFSPGTDSVTPAPSSNSRVQLPLNEQESLYEQSQHMDHNRSYHRMDEDVLNRSPQEVFPGQGIQTQSIRIGSTTRVQSDQSRETFAEQNTIRNIRELNELRVTIHLSSGEVTVEGVPDRSSGSEASQQAKDYPQQSSGSQDEFRHIPSQRRGFNHSRSRTHPGNFCSLSQYCGMPQVIVPYFGMPCFPSPFMNFMTYFDNSYTQDQAHQSSRDLRHGRVQPFYFSGSDDRPQVPSHMDFRYSLPHHSDVTNFTIPRQESLFGRTSSHRSNRTPLSNNSQMQNIGSLDTSSQRWDHDDQRGRQQRRRFRHRGPPPYNSNGDSV